jgi:hypothetical protein
MRELPPQQLASETVSHPRAATGAGDRPRARPEQAESSPKCRCGDRVEVPSHPAGRAAVHTRPGRRQGTAAAAWRAGLAGRPRCPQAAAQSGRRRQQRPVFQPVGLHGHAGNPAGVGSAPSDRAAAKHGARERGEHAIGAARLRFGSIRVEQRDRAVAVQRMPSAASASPPRGRRRAQGSADPPVCTSVAPAFRPDEGSHRRASRGAAPDLRPRCLGRRQRRQAVMQPPAACTPRCPRARGHIVQHEDRQDWPPAAHRRPKRGMIGQAQVIPKPDQ